MNYEPNPIQDVSKARRGERWFVRDHIIKPIQKENQNRVILITGATDSGKSYASLRLAELIFTLLERETDERFFLFFDDRQFIDYIYDSPKKGMFPLDVILYDDPGITEASAYRQMTRIGQMFNAFLQSWRHRNAILMVSAPTSMLLNKSMRRFAHFELKPPSEPKRWAIPKRFGGQTGNIDRRNKESIWDLKRMEFESSDPRTGSDKVYHKYIRQKLRPSGEIVRVENLILKQPNPHWIEEYEKRKGPEILEVYKRMIDSFKYRKQAKKMAEEEAYVLQQLEES